MTTTHAPDATDDAVVDVAPDRGGDDAAAEVAATGPLVPASVTADRERVRLRVADGRHGAVRVVSLVGPTVRYLGSAQAAQNGLRYRPVAWTLIAIVALAFYLPGRTDGPPASQASAVPSPVTTAPAETDAPPENQPVAAAPDIPPSSPLPNLSPATTPSTPAPSGPPTTIAPTGPATGDAATSTPLRVREWAWASRLPPTPLPTDEVAEDTLPVATRLGSVERVSFLRLGGNDLELVLAEHAESAREALGPGAVAICPVIDAGWEEGPGQSFEDAPTWDSDACVGGVETEDTWTFDLSGFDARTGDAGFALVPTVDAPADFQLAFEVRKV